MPHDQDPPTSLTPGAASWRRAPLTVYTRAAQELLGEYTYAALDAATGGRSGEADVHTTRARRCQVFMQLHVCGHPDTARARLDVAACDVRAPFMVRDFARELLRRVPVQPGDRTLEEAEHERFFSLTAQFFTPAEADAGELPLDDSELDDFGLDDVTLGDSGLEDGDV